MAVSEHYWRLARAGGGGDRRLRLPGPAAAPGGDGGARNGVTRFTHAARLRMKESDRLRTTAALLAALGGQAEEGPDFLTVRGGPLTAARWTAPTTTGSPWRRPIAATHCAGPVTVLGAEWRGQILSSFWEDYRKLGGITMNTLGHKLRVTVFGQSHAPAIGCVVEGLPEGFIPDMDRLAGFLARRAPGADRLVHPPAGIRRPGDPLRAGGGADLRDPGVRRPSATATSAAGTTRACAAPPALPRRLHRLGEVAARATTSGGAGSSPAA